MSQTTEIQIQNQNGLSFRTKLNQMLSALNTVFAGTTAPTVTEADMLWMDTSVTPNVLKRRNSSDTAWEIVPLVESATLAAASKATPVDADLIPIVDSADSNALKKLTWANVKATLKTYFDTLYVNLSGSNLTGPVNANKGVDIASSATVNIGAATGEYVTITGTTTITAFDTVQAGTMREVRFSGALTLTHNATSLILPTAANITTAAGDCATFRSEGSGNWRCVSYQRADGTSLAGGLANQRMSQTSTVSLTGGIVDITGIPTWAKKITISFTGLSTTTSAYPVVQIGTSGGVQNTGYVGGNGFIAAASAAAISVTAGFGIGAGTGNWTAAAVVGGVMEIVLQDPTTHTWAEKALLGGTNGVFSSGGVKQLSAQLDRIRVTTHDGSGAFDGGTVSLLIEGY